MVGRRRLLMRSWPGVLLPLVVGWLVWPLLRPRIWPASGPPLLVVLDGYHRLDWALRRQARSGNPILLITCPATGQPTAAQWARQRMTSRLQSAPPPLLLLHQGFDTATQAAALAQWLQRRQQQGVAPPRQLLLVSDAHHFPRASWAAQIATGGSGSQVLPAPVPMPTNPTLPNAPWWKNWPSWRDALRLQLWRTTGSTGAFLKPRYSQLKAATCAEKQPS